MIDRRSLKGACLCGSVQFTAIPKDNTVGACHCNMCRRWAGGVFLAIDCEDKVTFQDKSAIGIFKSSQWAERGFCKKCGTALFWKMQGQEKYIFSVATLEDPGDLLLDHEIFVDEQPNYYAFQGDTKKMTGEEVFAFFAADKDDG